MSDILNKILETKHAEVAAATEAKPLKQMQEEAYAAPDPRDFAGSIHAKIMADQPAVIAEIKKASPSKGVIREDFKPAAIAKSWCGLSFCVDRCAILSRQSRLPASGQGSLLTACATQGFYD
jgi:indole-3-glycerol phosphate synthase